MRKLRHGFALASIASFVTVVAVSLAFSPRGAREWLAAVGVAAVAIAVQSAWAEHRDLLATLALCLAPLLGVIGREGDSVLVIPLAVLLLVGAELNVLGWRQEGRGDELGPIGRRRLRASARLALLGLGGAAGIALVGESAPAGETVLFAVAVIGLLALGGTIFRGDPDLTPPDGSGRSGGGGHRGGSAARR